MLDITICYHFVATAQNDSIERVRYQMLEQLLQPCGPPPIKDEESEDNRR
jgi:hypothetical protein